MASFTTLTAHAVLLSAENVDTDQIIPARFLKTLDKNGLGKQLFFDWRYLPDGAKVKFPIDNFSQHCLLNGIDQLGYILSFDEKIKAFESAHA